jgi:hypothetical protein
MFIHQCFGASRTSFGTIFQYATTIIKSNSKEFKLSKNSKLFLNFSGCNKGILFSRAITFIAVGTRSFFLQIGLSGWLTTSFIFTFLL